VRRRIVAVAAAIDRRLRDRPPALRHVVVVVFENTNYSTIKAHAPYFMALADRRALMTALPRRLAPEQTWFSTRCTDPRNSWVPS